LGVQRGRFRLEYFRTQSGREPVATWLSNRTLRERTKVFWWLERLAESGFLLGPPALKKLDDDIWELRVQYGGKFLRLLFYQRSERVFVLLDAFAKKDRKLRPNVLQRARGRMMQDWGRG